MTRQRLHQIKWENQGRCGNCKSHPPIYRGSKCRKCYQYINIKKLGRKCRNRLLCNKTLEKQIKQSKDSIAKHHKWIAEYRLNPRNGRDDSALIGKHMRWIGVHLERISTLKKRLHDRITSARAASSPASSPRKKSCSSSPQPLHGEAA